MTTNAQRIVSIHVLGSMTAAVAALAEPWDVDHVNETMDRLHSMAQSMGWPAMAAKKAGWTTGHHGYLVRAIYPGEDFDESIHTDSPEGPITSCENAYDACQQDGIDPSSIFDHIALEDGFRPVDCRWCKPDAQYGEKDMEWGESAEDIVIEHLGYRDLEDLDPAEHYEVTDWLAAELEKAGEIVTRDFLGKNIWSVCTAENELAKNPVLQAIDLPGSTASADAALFLIGQLEEIALGSSATEDGEGEEFDLEGQNAWLGTVAHLATEAVKTGRAMIREEAATNA